jgi:peptidoglycan/xylan/chitin deacetylase (PgdA/CDA1 family)
MFHGLNARSGLAARQSQADAFYTISETAFRSILVKMRDNGLRSHTASDLLVGLPLERAIAFTFDDGWESDYLVALPALLDVRMRATFFVVTDWIGKDRFMTAGQLREMATLGMDIQVHGKTHRFLADLPDQELHAELYMAKTTLEDIVGKEVLALSYPGGRGSAKVRNIARDLGYRCFYSSRPGWFTGREHEIPRMVIHSRTRPGDIYDYVSGKYGPVFRQLARYYSGRALRRLLGNMRYTKAKSFGRRAD